MEFPAIFTTIILPIIAAFLGSGIVTGWISYKASRPKTLSESKKIEADVTTTFADGWEKYALKLEGRMSDMETRYEKRIKELEELIAKKEEEHILAVRLKDDKIRALEDRVDSLEKDLLKYQDMGSKVETAKEGLHIAVEDNLGGISK